MKSATSLVAKQYRLQEWAAQISECHNRPAGMKVSEWCELHGITKDSYYYRLKKVREACLETAELQEGSQEIVDVSDKFFETSTSEAKVSCDLGLDICFSSCSVHVTEQTPLDLLTSVIQVIAHAQ